MVEQAKVTCSPLGKTFQKQIKANEDQGEKQIKALKEHGKQLLKSSCKKRFFWNKKITFETKRFFE